MYFVDLFSGAGGMTLGLEQAGFKNVFSIEYNAAFAKTYRYNFPKHNLLIKDIKDLTKKEIKEAIGSKKISLVVGGPPCQGFSIAGNIGRSFVHDERNYLFKEFVRVVGIIKPTFFMMENVARMEIHNKGKTIEEVMQEFEKLGYKVTFKVLQTSDYGIPQKRRRIFIVGYLGNEKFKFPNITNSNNISIKKAIGDLPKLNSGEKSDLPNHNAMNHTQQMLEKMSYIQDGGDREQIPKDLRPKTGDARKYIKYDSKKPSPTVTGDMRKIFHYEQNRALTSRELARIQTFPDNFIFKGTSINIQQQIGNAVPPKLALILGEEIIKFINKEIKHD